MQFFRCTVPTRDSSGVVSRILPAIRPGEPAAVQALVACNDGLRPLAGADGLSGLELGPPLQLYADPAAYEGEPAAARRPYTPKRQLAYPVWDPFSSAVYMCEGHAILRLASDNTVTVVAGDVEERGGTDGPGRAARFTRPACLTADGAGSLYVAEWGVRHPRKLLLPGLGPDASAAVMAAADGAVGGGGQATAAAAAAAVTAEGEVLVSSLQPGPDVIVGLAFDGGISSGAGSSSSSGSLLFATQTAVYRLPLGDPSADPTLLAGAERAAGAVDGRGGDARFFPHTASCWTLPCSHAAAASLLPTVPPGPPPRTLPTDLAALLARQPDGTADVTIMVGDRTFHAHRGLLCARSDYFQQRFGTDFADGSTHQISLPDADPDALEAVLRFAYTGTADIPAVQAAGVAELADRLLLPELREQALAVLEASITAVTVVGLLLWAEARGPAFAGLLSRLKAWYVGNHEAVMREAAEEVRMLAARSLDL
ncbi:Kelch-like protein 30 [Tetrabaena socialis]|uniref:Kelch-like protein 30 n=1 Tax=Tetrabaena socialis TaxID=47790 RepID=A0A2J7ZXS3_9CHLO|nr:Kelch-like protein 30 [Tetrabaena socialis]|eukprot:PNH05066.1 Kelch-like protein 30 [Tetrabaena socialis]